MPSKPRPHSGALHLIGGSTAPCIDVDRFRADLAEAGVEEMIGDLLDTFAQDCPGRMAALELAVQEQDFKAIESAAHAFKSGAGTVRATFLADCLGRAEAAARAGDLESVGGLLVQIRTECQAVLHELAASSRQ